jgi:hypothetical protein
MAKRPESAQTGVQAGVLLKEACNELNWVCNPFIEDFGIDFHIKAGRHRLRREDLRRCSKKRNYEGDVKPKY